jgi:hypothetical protein
LRQGEPNGVANDEVLGDEASHVSIGSSKVKLKNDGTNVASDPTCLDDDDDDDDGVGGGGRLAAHKVGDVGDTESFNIA